LNTKTLIFLCARCFKLVRLQIADLVLKAVVSLLVEKSTEKLQSILLQKISGSRLAEEIMKEVPRITSLRK
jgi:hypothetical protein